MKQVVKKVVYIAVAILIFFVQTKYVEGYKICATSLGDKINVSRQDECFFEKQKESIVQYKRMFDSFESANKSRQTNGQVYNANYGGAYINDDGELTVLIVEKNRELEALYRDYTGNAEIILKSCDYSYQQLIDVIDNVNSKLDYLIENDIIVQEMYEDVYTNRVKIGISEYDEEKEKILRNLVNVPYVDIYEKASAVMENETIDMKGGEGIISSDNDGNSTLGFCAKLGNQEGFVIAGHAGDKLYENFKVGRTSVGYVTKTAYYNNTTADAAFLAKSAYASVTPYIDIYKCHSVATGITDLPVGTEVYMYGKQSKLQSGKIVSNYFTAYSSANKMYTLHQTSATYSSQGGDSGAPVFMITDVINGSVTCKLLGIHKAQGVDVSVFSKYYKIVEELGISAIIE